MVSPENMRGSEDRPPVAEQTADNQSPAEQSIDDSSSEEQSEANNSPINSSEFDMLREEELSSLSTEELLRQREVLEASLEGTRYIAVAGDFSRDKRALAGRHAKGILDRELSTKEKGKLFDKLGKRIFRKYYERKYTRDLVSGEMKVTLNDGEEYTLDELIKRDSEAPLSRFVEGINEDLDNGFVGSKYIHSEIGIENKSTGDNAESYEKADARTTQILKGAIEAFADSPDTMKLLEADSGKMSDAFKAAFDKKLHDFYEAANSKLANAGKDQVVLNEFNNYAKVAWDALQTHRHGMAMDKVMQGFAVYNAKVRDGARSESHREHLDNILVALDSRHLTFAADAVAVGAGVWATLARTGSRMLFGVAAGGAVTSAVLGGIRTHDRYTSTRAEMFYDAELGGDNAYAGKTDKEIKAMRLKGRERYEAKIGNTVYEMKKATDLIDSIDKAFDGDDSEAILQAIADARIRIDLSDRTQKSLIAYTKGKVGDERLALDMTVIKLENALSGIGKERYEVILDEVKAKIKEETEATDRNFNTKRRRAVIGKIAASATFSLGSYFLSQEIKAAFDGETAGLYDTLRKTPAASTAKKETVLTKLFAHGK
ncbi:MAG: hypothetical protein IKG04_08620, partial [Exiguobacterium sp.]|nr:hypothetical protein [Exiguobacterium sp.]